MTVKDIEQLYAYSCWANNKLFDVISQLSPAAFTQPIAGSFGSIRNTMTHIMSAEWGWLDRCGGTPRTARINPEDYSNAASLLASWADVQTYVETFISELKDEDLERPVEYVGEGPHTCTLPLGDLLLHMMNHASHHRGQVALLLRMQGHPPGNIDLLFYYEKKYGRPVW